MLTLCLSTTCQKRGRVRVVRHALEHQRRRAVRERAVHDVGVAGDPADVGRAPVDLAVAIVEDLLVGQRRIDQVAAGGVQHALGLAGRAGGVEDEQRVLGAHRLRAGSRPRPRRTASWYQMSRPVLMSTSPPVWRTTSTVETSGQAFSASSALAFSGTLRPPRTALVGGDQHGRARNPGCGRSGCRARSRRTRRNGSRRSGRRPAWRTAASGIIGR